MDGRPTDRRSDWLRLAVLLIFAASVRLWLLSHTEVAARDSIDFIRVALRFEEHSWGEVMRTSLQPPGYPLLILGASKIVRPLDGGTTSDSMVLSAQLVSMIAGLLTVIPMYLGGRRLFGPNAGFLAALLFQAFPVCVRVTSDGLSEGPFFLFAATAIWLGIGAIRGPSLVRLLLCGMTSGLAYLTRPEGLELAVAIGAVFTFAGIAAQSWRPTAKGLMALACGLAPFVGVYFAVTGHLTRKPTSLLILKAESRPVAAVASGPPLATFWDTGDPAGRSRAVWSATSVLKEASRSGHYYALGLAAVSVWWFRRRLSHEAAPWVLIALPALHFLLLWRMACAVGYVSERHTMMLAFAAAFWAGALLAHVARQFRAARWAVPVIAAIVVAIGLPSTLKPMHANRAGLHAAGCWIARHAGPGDEVIDPYAFAHYYSGAVFREGKDVPGGQTRYVVIEQSGNEHARLGGVASARELAERGKPVYQWPEGGPATVVVYKVDK